MCIQCIEYCSRIAASAPESSAHGDAFFNLDVDAGGYADGVQEYFCGAPGQIGRVLWHIGMSAMKGDAGFVKREADGIMQVNAAHQGVNIMIPVWTFSGHREVEIYFRRGVYNHIMIC